MIEKLRQLNELRKKSKSLEDELANEVIEVEHRNVTVQVAANMSLRKLDSNGQSDEVIVDAINKALKEVQKIAAKKMRSQMGDLGLNIPGLS